ncbi:MAG TPA: MFS transporter [Noviherbaspirillum sp.]|nr:MFS transporter [Noviherbaspirillum sp.]
MFRNRNFRWLFAGSLISQLGDQFTLIALPWLVLRMTGDTLALGTVLATMSVPRAVFILLGGAVVDRYSPKVVLLLSKYACTLLLGLLAVLTLNGQPDLRLVYMLALAIGIATAFSLPSGTSILPTVIPGELLAQANGVMMGVRQMSTFIGPLLAGILIALFGEGTGRNEELIGTGIAFGFDAASFALSAWTLTKVRTQKNPAPAVTQQPQSVWRSVADGLRYCWNDRSLRICFCYWGAVAFFITGPIQVAMPVLADHVGGSASVYGLLTGAYGAGTLVGIIFSSMRPGFRIGSFGMTILILDAAVGLLFIPLGFIEATSQGIALLLAIGVLGGFLQVNIFTWLQHHVVPAMLGRSMALFMFIFMGIAPMSSSATGWLMRSISLQQLFAISGGLLIAIVLVTFGLSGMRSVVDANKYAPR